VKHEKWVELLFLLIGPHLSQILVPGYKKKTACQ